MQIRPRAAALTQSGIYLLKLCGESGESELNWSYFVVGEGEAKSCGQSGYKSNQKTRQDEWPKGRGREKVGHRQPTEL